MKSYSGKLRQSSNNCWQHENIKNCPKTPWTLFEVGEKLLRCQRQKQEQQGYSGKTAKRISLHTFRRQGDSSQSGKSPATVGCGAKTVDGV